MPGLLIPPVPVDHERASMVLPSIKCSSCGDPIPLAAMGDHVCRPPSRSAKSSRSNQRHYNDYDEPLPSPSYSQSRSGQSSRHRQDQYDRHDRSDRVRDRDRAPARPAFGGPSPMSPPGGLQIPPPPSSSGSSRLSPHSASSNSRSPSPHTPSPTNPFFPAQAAEQADPGLSVFGLGFNAASVRPEGPFPNDRPLPAGVSDLLSLTGDDKPGGAGAGVGGMAGVGRRAFQAAAWGVTAGVALASRSKSAATQPPSSAPMASAPRSAGAEPSSRAPWQQPQANIQPPPRSGSSQQRHRGGTEPKPADFYPQHNDVPPRSASAMDRRHQNPVRPASPPRSTPIQASRSADHNHGYHRPPPRHQNNGSLSSATSIGSPDPGISGMLRSRANERTPKSSAKSGGGFFERYKQMQSSSSSNDPRRLLSVGKGGRDDHGRQRTLVDSPEQSVYDLADAYEDMDGDSALPWATPQLEDSPEIKQSDKLPRIRTNPSKLHHQRHRGDSEASSNSSGSRRYDLTSGPESEEVVTPSTSFEGLSDRMQNGRKPSKDRYGYDVPQDRRPPVAPTRKGTEPSRDRERERDRDRDRVKKSSSNSTITPKERSRTLPDPSPSVSSSRSRSTPKTCAKCGDTVGGSRKFVERDGVVLCEADWKKMYLPSCRKCHQLIETKMVSADDGQLKGKWHASCFTCSRCDKPFEGKDFYVHAGRPWCQYHYAKETGTLCGSSSCRKPIEGPCIVVQGSSNPLRFHPGHLRCDHRDSRGDQSCREAMDEYFDVGGKRYCDRHVGEALKAASAGQGGKGGKTLRAEKRKTRLVDLPSGGW